MIRTVPQLCHNLIKACIQCLDRLTDNRLYHPLYKVTSSLYDSQLLKSILGLHLCIIQLRGQSNLFSIHLDQLCHNLLQLRLHFSLRYVRCPLLFMQLNQRVRPAIHLQPLGLSSCAGDLCLTGRRICLSQGGFQAQ